MMLLIRILKIIDKSHQLIVKIKNRKKEKTIFNIYYKCIYLPGNKLKRENKAHSIQIEELKDHHHSCCFLLWLW